MGLEYIRSASGRPYTKRWAKGLNRLKTPTLLDVTLTEENPCGHRRFGARLRSETRRRLYRPGERHGRSRRL